MSRLSQIQRRNRLAQEEIRQLIQPENSFIRATADVAWLLKSLEEAREELETAANYLEMTGRIEEPLTGNWQRNLINIGKRIRTILDQSE